MTSLRQNLVRRIERLPKPADVAGALQPLFEAISNSIHSTQGLYQDHVSRRGKLVVTVQTDRRKRDVWATVEDNGFGLNEANWQAFLTTDTDNKISIGGKGIGRLLWLDCFENIEINSVYQTESGKKQRRAFNFVLSGDEQIKNLAVEKAVSETPSSFFVRFKGLRDNGYRDKFPGRDSFIFQHITSHFLPIFIGGHSPQIHVIVGDEERIYPDAINSIVLRKETSINLKTEEYGLLFLTMMECEKVASADLKGSHFVHFIAHDRTVHSQSIDAKLGLKYFGGNEDHVFHAILTGQFLDDNVNQERTAFRFGDSVIEHMINQYCGEHINDFLREPLQKLSDTQRHTIEKITESYPSVAFGDTQELQQRLPSGELSPDAIYGHLSRERFRRDQRQAEKVRAVLTRLKEGAANVATFASAIADARSAIEEVEQRSLTEYVVRRKVVLDFIEILLQNVRDDTRDSAYQREDILHSFICPLRINTLSDKKIEPATSHDLWIIDERLTFAQYFSSDVEFSTLFRAVQSDERPDVLIFDYVHGLRQTKEPTKVLLVEFKRPGRTDYNDDENPQEQVQRYIRRMLSGSLSDVRGRPIRLDQAAVFYCFIVADIIGKLEDWTFTWRRTADGRGRLYQPEYGFNGSIEIIGWDALLADARARNEAFFDKMGISGKSFFSTDE